MMPRRHCATTKKLTPEEVRTLLASPIAEISERLTDAFVAEVTADLQDEVGIDVLFATVRRLGHADFSVICEADTSTGSLFLCCWK